MKRLLLAATLTLAAVGQALAAPITQHPPAPIAPDPKELAVLRNEVEILRGKKFLHDVPARQITEQELRDLVDRDLEKDYPGRKLTDLQELMVWLDLLPRGADLRLVCEDLLVDQVAGLYDTDTKTMCIPVPTHSPTNRPSAKSPTKTDDSDQLDTAIVFAHEYTHALEDQYWPIDNPKDKETEAFSDSDTARSFLVEGSATRLMIEAIPAEWEKEMPGTYVPVWDALHSGFGEFVIGVLLERAWKSPDVKVPGVPEALARSEAMPYSFGYRFCRRITRDWGLDGLDYIYDHPPVSSKQVMHPEKCWEWRQLPVEVALPENIPGGWKRLSDDTIGEAGTAALLGSQLKSLNRGLRLARGWDGDRAALYEGPKAARLLVWASSWDSPAAAQSFARACAEERALVHHASLTSLPDHSLNWTRPDGSAGRVRCDGKRVLLLETDTPAALKPADAGSGPAIFTEPSLNADRAAANTSFRRFNPLFASQIDGDYRVTRTLGGLLERHDHNSIGAADRVLLGLVGEWRHTTSLQKSRFLWGLLLSHQSEARRGLTKTTLLPWGVLESHFSARLPESPAQTVSRDSLLWGLLLTRNSVEHGRQAWRVLPAGLLFRSTASPGKSAVHVLGTGISRTPAATRYRLLGIPLWTTRPR